MANSNNSAINRGITMLKGVSWTALILAFAALGLGLWLVFRPAPKAVPASPVAVSRSVSSAPAAPGSMSLFDLKEFSYFPGGIVQPIQATVNRVLSRVGTKVNAAYTRDKAKIDAKLKSDLAMFEMVATNQDPMRYLK